MEELGPDIEVMEEPTANGTSPLAVMETSDAGADTTGDDFIASFGDTGQGHVDAGDETARRAERKIPLQIECASCGHTYEWRYYGRPRKYCYDCRPSKVRSGSAGASKKVAHGDTSASEAEWIGFISEKVLSYGVTVYVSWLTSPFKDLTDAECEALLMTSKERSDVARPLGKALAKTGLNARYGRAIMDAGDVIDALFSLADWFSRTRPILKERKTRKEIVIRNKRSGRKYGVPTSGAPQERSADAVSPSEADTGGPIYYSWGAGESL